MELLLPSIDSTADQRQDLQLISKELKTALDREFQFNHWVQICVFYSLQFHLPVFAHLLSILKLNCSPSPFVLSRRTNVTGSPHCRLTLRSLTKRVRIIFGLNFATMQLILCNYFRVPLWMRTVKCISLGWSWTVWIPIIQFPCWRSPISTVFLNLREAHNIFLAFKGRL